MAINKATLERGLGVLQRLQPWADYSLDWADGQPRLVRDGESRIVSQRGTKRELYAYLRVMIEAIEIDRIDLRETRSLETVEERGVTYKPADA